MDTREMYEELREVEGNLRKLCHNPQCENYKECPLKHMECRDALDLHTAIAWTVADIIHEVLEYAEAGIEIKCSIEGAIRLIISFQHVITLDGKHLQLLIYMDIAYNLLRDILKYEQELAIIKKYKQERRLP
jgi:hypothetical protein